jgi:glycosyltransferase involved in cell wall biosynthesis
MIKVSIIIPMYNVAEYLNTCLQSVLNQTLPNDTFEVIMVNDESPDNSLEIAQELAAKYAFIKIISQKNKGLGGARNAGIDNAQGVFLLFLDADDWLLPNTLKLIIETANSNHLDILEFGANLVDNNRNVLATISHHSDNKIYTGVNYYNTIKYSGSACNKLYSKKFINTNKLRFLEKIYGEDFEFNTRAFFMATKVLAIHSVCAEFLQSPNSITRKKSKCNKDKYLNDFITILKSISNFKRVYSYDTENKNFNTFFKERLTMVNINAFYLMFKNNYSFSEMINYKNKLISQNLFFIEHPVAIKKKELFRKYILNNFAIFKVTQPIKSLLNI